jgi:hypothetical protein
VVVVSGVTEVYDLPLLDPLPPKWGIDAVPDFYRAQLLEHNREIECSY